MTTTGRTASVVPSFHRPAVFWPVVAVTGAVTAILLFSSPPSWAETLVVIVAIAGLGIPHGSLDHVVTARLQGDRFSLRRFVTGYVGAMAAVGVLWLASPTAALVVFIAGSVHHFGQSDLAHLDLGGRRQPLLQWSRGLLVIVLPLLAHLDQVAPVVQRLGADGLADWAADTTIPWPWLAGIIGLHVLALAAVAVDLTALEVRREVVAIAALSALLLVAEPLIGFAVYFGLWHSVNHLLVLADTVGSGDPPLRGVIRQAVPLTAVSLAGLAAFAGAAVAAGRPELVVPLAFVFVSMLTLPHLVVVERLWRWRLGPTRATAVSADPVDA